MLILIFMMMTLMMMLKMKLVNNECDALAFYLHLNIHSLS